MKVSKQRGYHMSKYSDELERRLNSGEPIEETRSWFTACLGNEYPNEVELSPFEQSFHKDMMEAWPKGNQKRA
jgi:hypothetical protein